MRGLDRVATVFFVAIVSGVAASLAPPLDVAALQLQANASVSPSVVPLNGQFTLEVELRGANRVDAEPSLPELGDFSRYIGRNYVHEHADDRWCDDGLFDHPVPISGDPGGHVRDRGRGGPGWGTGAPDAAGHLNRIHGG